MEKSIEKLLTNAVMWNKLCKESIEKAILILKEQGDKPKYLIVPPEDIFPARELVKDTDIIVIILPLLREEWSLIGDYSSFNVPRKNIAYLIKLLRRKNEFYK